MDKHSMLVTIPFLVAIVMAASPATTVSATLPTTTAASRAAAPDNISSIAPATAPADAPSTPSAYDMLQQYNLAPGILPLGVTGYVLRPDGSFEVYLPAECNIRAGGLTIRYDSVIKGSIQSQSISDVQGVHVKEAFLWIDITKVDASDGQLHFFAGLISKSFPMDKFAHSPQCN
jgi:hypothetical protein